METITHYSGQVLANLQGPAGYMRCDFRLMRPELGHLRRRTSGTCQLPTGTIINTQFPPSRGDTEVPHAPGLRSEGP